MKKLAMIFLFCFIVMSGCKPTTTKQNEFPYLDQWIEHSSDGVILKYQFNRDGTIRVNRIKDRCCITAFQGEYQFIGKVIHIQYHDEASTAGEEIAYSYVNNVLTLEINDVNLVFTAKE